MKTHECRWCNGSHLRIHDRFGGDAVWTTKNGGGYSKKPIRKPKGYNDPSAYQASLSECLKSAGPRSVAADAATARELRIASTPAFFIGLVRPDGQVDVVRTVSGAQQFDVFDEALRNVIGVSTGSDAPPGR